MQRVVAHKEILVYLCGEEYATALKWRSEGSLLWAISFFRHVGPRDGIQVARLGGEPLNSNTLSNTTEIGTFLLNNTVKFWGL